MNVQEIIPDFIKRGWTNDLDQKLIDCLAKGLTSREMVPLLHKTRNAIISRANKLKKKKIIVMPKIIRHLEPDEKLEQIRQLAANNMCAKHIAEQTGIGIYIVKEKCRIHGIVLKNGRLSKVKRKYKAENPKEILHGFLPIFAGEGISLMQAGKGQCRWPLDGRGADGNPRCCGQKQASDHASYCSQHTIASRGVPYARWKQGATI